MNAAKKKSKKNKKVKKLKINPEERESTWSTKDPKISAFDCNHGV